MKILVDLTSLSYHMSGIERYAASVTEQMLEQDNENEYILVFREEVHPLFQKYKGKSKVQMKVLQGDNKLLFMQVILPLELYKLKADRYLFFAFTSPILFFRKGIYSTIHDMGPWDSGDSMSTLQKLYWRVSILVSAWVSQGLITVSNFSKGRIAAITKVSPNKINVIHSAVHQNVIDRDKVSAQETRVKYLLPDKYIMDLSTLEPRKNLQFLLEAYEGVSDQVDYDLVLVGRKGWMMDEVLAKYASKDRIHITGFVEDEYVSHIYENALCFVFPSLYEGFGLPPVEALTLGTPVLAADAASIPEVMMDRASYFKNDDLEELKDKLIHLEENLPTMATQLNDFQKENYRFETAARKVLKLIGAN